MNLDKMIAVRNNKTVYRDGDRCLKVFCEGTSKADVLNEALNQARAEEAGLHVPAVWEVTAVDGRPTLVTAFIKGKTLAQHMQEEPERRREHLEMLVQLQQQVHACSCPTLQRLKDTLNVRICRSDLPATVRFDLHSKLEAMPRHGKLCHGDLVPTNVLVAEDGTPYLLDWAHAAQGNASADAAHTYLRFCMDGDEECAREYLEIFCRISGISPAYVSRWIPIVAAAESTSGSEERRAFLKTRANAVDGGVSFVSQEQ